ncbi:MAG: DUF3795 domain-containing protein [Nitrospira sp.]|nr:DUF3795 domain-containing protein [Nitrospira sp.]
MIAYCGLDCEKCEAFIATKNNDNHLRAKVSEEWAKLYNAPIMPEHINCTGCRSEGIKTYYCEQMCEIRKCAIGKSLESCATCDTFPCSHLNEVFKFALHARDTLESMRKR